MDVFSNEYVTSEIDFMKTTASENEKIKFQIIKGDILLTKDSETSEEIANTAVVLNDISSLLCGYHLAIIRPDKIKVNSIFLSKVLFWGKSHRYFITHANGVTRFGLTFSTINNAPVWLPDCNEQEKAVDVLVKCDFEMKILRKQVFLLKKQKQGLMQKLLTGEVRVKL